MNSQIGDLSFIVSAGLKKEAIHFKAASHLNRSSSSDKWTTPMNTRELGHSGIQVPPLCFGGNVFGWTADQARSFELLDALLASGLNFVDTADAYSIWVPGNVGGESETILGNWFAARRNRDKVILATKVGMKMGEDKRGLSRKYIREAVEASLRRLHTDYIDLYQSHRDDELTPQAETLAAYGELIQEGKVRAIGASNFTPARLQSALEASRKHRLPRYESLQPEYNLYDRGEYESGLQQVCVSHGLGVIPYFSLASGFLTGKYRSQEDAAGKAREARVQKYFNPRGMRILAALDEVARETNSKPAQVALAWLMARPGITAPIASATTVEQLHQLVASTRLRLSPAAIQALHEASAETVAA
jgi:aryl-alcohol dehydrogenase-like predicted oxidoreductase